MQNKNVSANALAADTPPRGALASLGAFLDSKAHNVLIMPAVIIVLIFSVFPLIVSLYLSFTTTKITRGGFTFDFVGLRNYQKLLSGSEQRYFLGRFTELELPALIVLGAFVLLMLYMLIQYARSPRFRVFGFIMRIITIVIATALAYVVTATLTGRGIPGNLVVTLIFVFFGVSLQYFIGLGLAMILTQDLPGKRFFRIAFLLPMMITPVGIAFLFRMLSNTTQGPFAPVWRAIGGDFSWVDTAHGARTVIIIGDTWQWVPFMFIILLAALEGVSRETIEAAQVDGASRPQIFRYIILPDIIPVSTTVILIRMIEAFKLIDIPNVMLGGGPGTATETMTLYAYKQFRAPELGITAATSYLLLFVVTFVALVFFNFIRRRLLEYTQ